MNRPEHMRAAFIDALGEAGSIRVGDLPVPDPAATEVLVRMEASVANHVDLFVRSGAFLTPLPFPFVIGRDLVGTAVAGGGAVAAFGPGARAWRHTLGHGARR